MKRTLVFFLLYFVAFAASAATILPVNLNKSDRTRALQILGFGSAAKILDNPYPLGGYSGLEVGLSSEFIPMEDLAALGDGTTDSGEFSFYTLTFAKGLYNNVDVHVYFTPLIQNEDLESFGGQLRWGFFESISFPLSLTAVISAGAANFSNLVNISTLGADLVATVAMEDVALYVGVGRTRALGTFIGGPDGVTDTGETIYEDVIEDHTLFGINIEISKMFLALQIDRYADTVYSGKLGFRF